MWLLTKSLHALYIILLLFIQIPHDVELAPVPCTDRNFFPQGDSNQLVSHSMEPRHDALDYATTVWELYIHIQDTNK